MIPLDKLCNGMRQGEREVKKQPNSHKSPAMRETSEPRLDIGRERLQFLMQPTMGIRATTRNASSLGRVGAAGLMLSLYVFLWVLAQSEALHRIFHDDAGRSEHHCVVEIVRSGFVEVGEPGLAAPVTPAPLGFELPREHQALVFSFYLLPPGRAPPLA